MSKLHEGKQRLEHIKECKICQYRIKAVLEGKKSSTAIKESKKIE